MLQYERGLFAQTVMKLYKMCHSEIPQYPELQSEVTQGTSQALVTTLITTMKILINMTHSSQKEGTDMFFSMNFYHGIALGVNAAAIYIESYGTIHFETL